jgi:hypothetical protein
MSKTVPRKYAKNLDPGDLFSLEDFPDTTLQVISTKKPYANSDLFRYWCEDPSTHDKFWVIFDLEETVLLP